MVSPVRAARAATSRLGRSQELPGFILAVGALLLAVLCCVAGLDDAALVLLVISVLGELALGSRSPGVLRLMDQGSFGAPMRFAVRVIVVLVASTDRIDSIAAWRALTAVSVTYALVLCGRALHGEYRRVGALKVLETRNIPGAPLIKDTPPSRTVEVTLTQLLVLVPALLGAEWISILLLGVVGTAVLAGATGSDAQESWRMRQQKRATGLTGPLRQVQDFLDDFQPEVIVHLSGPVTADYQINTWLESLEALDRRVFIVLRDQPLFAAMAPTSIPTLALPDAGELQMLDFSSVRIALFPSNMGNNIHLLRLPAIMSAFIGHGDSDKSASNNPFSRVYDELWVAGEAGADRYRRSGLGVHEDQYRFVGRPQVHGISREPRLGDQAASDENVPTVLYAPTWEGVNRTQEYSSVAAVGVQIVQALLASPSPVRIVFKAHPFTGERDAKYRAVVARISALLREAAASTGAEHLVVSGGSINEWFNGSSALITDVSSVVSDYLASEKPYAVFNHTELDDAAFRAAFPSTGAGTTIGRDGSGIAEFVEIVTGRLVDGQAATRADLATYLLGPPGARTLGSFRASVDAFIARSEAERAAHRTPT